ncbi:tRNA uridine(34) 5-carboxymethylaminomethyl modification radical SAM/GNAT enzyme Elp3 [Candidatus Roizmanbacteria bacterium CG_4_9_14_0_8_um_filter_34_12]|uniref:tRNA carboxymethyluridine synthase n=5 Tax=Candidatus Roizmaniibacteriota TaxID=1752723 RepID=A0A2M7E379_9BACT|nr:MAG: tRNA uridine(34) 5-carboxymethylaminomethyl modification radical SAM/GNAT enzyme Elp3 [Candidatus Roizmanbacteria bacterium CG22_combo_CG10-13_8_21_14_all_33_16]PIV62163.1 MAG: tRNA uridine(34) 5-carboxymethylaminomethyl modification radical SAM/GNAT enzyme Elp3 [Candidatus Roizmanbacteria bacterium CG01_land_8_20_14_3_00_33_9]PJB88179.1 MAG: tRNA uridine(34) 5-carboxymethylaminomethyl modification radical SAM/GNAT enzyme Elp3 [Candidatus Roizmanbacteria bacterium CG_4_9_14_0_8_um_filter_
MKMLYYPENFPRNKEKLLIDLFRYLQTVEIKKVKKLDQEIRKFFSGKKEKEFFPSYWMLHFVYWRHFHLKMSKVPDFIKLSQKHQVRSLSGIIPLSLFTKPQGSCPFHCIYCATEKDAPKSYFSDEPAVMRAVRNKYDPYLQTRNRLIQFFLSGHPIDKVDVIIQGGTFSFYSKEYREWFVSEIYRACNEDIKELIVKGVTIYDLGIKRENKKIWSLEKQIKINESASSRAVGLTVETRPDFIDEKECWFLRKLGVTRVEVGVQTLDNKVLKIIKRGHTILSVVKATKLLRDFGFKTTYHLMPGLPGSSVPKDLSNLKKVFNDERFKPDAIKFYPTQIVQGTELLEWYKKGKFIPLNNTDLNKIVTEFKLKIVPRWVRINRLVRDLTKSDVAVETFASNFRQNITVKCPCIRCREIKNRQSTVAVEFRLTEYSAGKGMEYFIEAVDKNDRLYGFVRLRITSVDILEWLRGQKLRGILMSNLKSYGLIRELHVYGPQIEIGKKGNVQHQGIGTKLMEKAEIIAQENKVNYLAVISGVGVREYYRKMGYELKESYMVKYFLVNALKN